jgi:hypothetical protein
MLAALVLIQPPNSAAAAAAAQVLLELMALTLKEGMVALAPVLLSPAHWLIMQEVVAVALT